MRTWEINGNLAAADTGLRNYESFKTAVCNVKALFDSHFGFDVAEKVNFLVDNATENSGFTPVCTPVLSTLCVIKLHIFDFDDEAQVAYQFAHELAHVLFYGYFGFDKEFATYREEHVCTAAALLVLHDLYPDKLQKYIDITLTYPKYANGVFTVDRWQYSWDAFQHDVEHFYD